MPRAVSKKAKIRVPSARSDDRPANRKMLNLVRDELKHDIRSLGQRMDSRFKQVSSNFSELDSRFSQIDSRFAQIDARFEQMESRFAQIDARFERLESKIDALASVVSTLSASVNRMATLMEQQAADNRMVLEGYRTLWEKYDRHEVVLQKAHLI